MTTRRFFIKQLIFSTGLLLTCFSRLFSKAWARAPLARKAKSRPLVDIFLRLIDDTKIKISYRFEKQVVDKQRSHPLQGAILCAVEARTQLPFCAPLVRKGGVQGLKQKKDKKFYYYEYTTDIVQTLQPPGRQGVFYVHAACRQFRSAVVAVSIKGLK